jgi:hypothetical protein
MSRYRSHVLNEDQVREIIALYCDRSIPLRLIATRYGISVNGVCNCALRRGFRRRRKRRSDNRGKWK